MKLQYGDTFYFEDLVLANFDIISWTEDRLAAISEQGKYCIFQSDGGRWRLIAVEHSLLQLKQ